MKAIVPIIFAVLFTSCTQAYNSFIEDRNYDKMVEMELYDGDFSDVSSPEDIGRWIHTNIEYEYDIANHWQTPKETVELKTGDCEDTALLYINILYFRFGIKAGIAMVMEGRTVASGGQYNHCIVYLPDGRLVSAQNGREFHGDVKFFYTFDEIFKGDL